jgi:HlyD family secretion protein
MDPGPSPGTPTTPTLALSARSASEPRRRGRWLAALLIMAAIPASLWAAGVRPDRFLATERPEWRLATVDRGDIAATVLESGSLESANNATVRCQVEALLGMIGGTTNQQGNMGGGGRGGGGAGGGRGGGAGGAGGSRTGGTAAGGTGYGLAGAARSADAAGQTKGAASKAGATAKAGTPGAAGAAGTGTGAGASTAAASTGIQRPMIRSFSYMVTPHMPLRPAMATNQATTLNQVGQMGMGAGGRGQQQNNNPFGEERAGSTRILKILEEGTRAEQGEVVCWLDTSAFQDELAAQMIRWTQAKSWVEQAEKLLEVGRIELREYRDGVLPQDQMVIEQYIQTCKVQRDQARIDLNWSMDMVARGLQSDSQAKRLIYSLEKTEVALHEAEGMRERLIRFTAPKLIRNIEAKIAAIEADLEAQKAAFVLEDQRKRRLERAIVNCELRAPRDGIVAYVNESNGWGRVETQIREGTTVRENQPIFQIPDPTRMRVKTRINESKVSLLDAGTPARVRVDAFPDKVLTGRVAEVTVIPTQVAGPFSDVKVYYANVDIEGFEGLRPGMSAEVEFLVNDRRDVPRVPVGAVRWFDGAAYVATPKASGFEWKRLELGVTDRAFVEVRSGLRPGERVIADPSGLAPPTHAERAALQVADTGARVGR